MRIIVGSDIAHYCCRIGAFDNRMAYVLGLRRLGHEVYVIAEVNPKRCHDSNYKPVRFEDWEGRRHFESLAKSYGVWPRCCLVYNRGDATYGMSLADAIKVAKSSDLLINISGKVITPEIFENVQCRVLIDLAPAKPRFITRSTASIRDLIGISIFLQLASISELRHVTFPHVA